MAVNKQDNTYPEAAFLLGGDFITGRLKCVFFYQNVSYASRGANTLDHFYSTHRNAYKPLPRSPFGKSDHDSILLLTVYE